MQGLPLVAYDFFAYVIPGALCLFAWDFAFHGLKLACAINRSGSSLWLGIGAVLLSFFIGHLVAVPGAYLTTHFSEFALRKRPVDRKHTGDLYMGALPETIRKQLWERAEADGAFDITADGAYNILYYRALSYYLSRQNVPSEIDRYLNAAAFCQYMSVACLISTIILLLGIKFWTSSHLYLGIGISFGLAASSVLLYLRCGRTYYRYMVRLYLLYLSGAQPLTVDENDTSVIG